MRLLRGADFQKMATAASLAVHRKVIKFCTEFASTPTETYKIIKKTQLHMNISSFLIFNWHNSFSRRIQGKYVRKRRPTEKKSMQKTV